MTAMTTSVQIQQIENFITSGVDLIMVHPSDPYAIEDYKTSCEAGIKVMCWDDKMENTESELDSRQYRT